MLFIYILLSDLVYIFIGYFVSLGTNKYINDGKQCFDSRYDQTPTGMFWMALCWPLHTLVLIMVGVITLVNKITDSLSIDWNKFWRLK